MSKRAIAKSIITITDAAVNQIKHLLQSKQDKNIIGVHLSTKLRGCSGNSYVMNYAENKLPTDEHIHHKGVDVYVDNKTVFLIIGTEMDYVENNVTSEFVFSNPNAKGTCGCGESFNT